VACRAGRALNPNTISRKVRKMSSFSLRRSIGIAAVLAALGALLLALMSPAQSAHAGPTHRAQLVLASAGPSIAVTGYPCTSGTCYEVEGYASPYGWVFVGHSSSPGVFNQSWYTTANGSGLYRVYTGDKYCGVSSDSYGYGYFQAYDYTRARYSPRIYLSGCE